VTSDDVHHGGPGGVEGRSSSPSHHIMLKMALVDTSWWLSRLGAGDEGSSWSRGLNEVITIPSTISTLGSLLFVVLLDCQYFCSCCFYRILHGICALARLAVMS
jgi:hypothetical protein